MKPLLFIFSGLISFFAIAQTGCIDTTIHKGAEAYSWYPSSHSDYGPITFVEVDGGSASGHQFSHSFEEGFRAHDKVGPHGIHIYPKVISKDCHVKRISVFDNSYGFKQKIKEVLIDSAGNEKAIFNLYTFWEKYENFKDKDGREYFVSTFYDKDTLVRIDTLVRYEEDLNRNDTICECWYSKIITYKRGSLINEQNAYYNKNYLNKKIKTD
jgi:hypothetical protein